MKDSAFYKEVGERIQQLRIMRGYTRDGMADKAGLSNKFLYEIEAGKKGFSVEILCRIAKALNVSCDYITKGSSVKGSCNQAIMGVMESFDEKQMPQMLKLLEAVRELSEKKEID